MTPEDLVAGPGIITRNPTKSANVGESARPAPQARRSNLGRLHGPFTGRESRNAPRGSSSPRLFHSSDPGSQQPPSLVTDEEGRGAPNKKAQCEVPTPEDLVAGPGIRTRNPTRSANVGESARPAPQARHSTLGRLESFTERSKSRKAPQEAAAVPDCFPLAIPGASNRQVS